MPDYVVQVLFETLQKFMAFGLIWFAHQTAKEGAHFEPKPKALLKAFAWCVGLSILFASAAGSASCLESDPMGGGCLEYDDDGYEATVEERISRFISLFALTFIPSMVGCMRAPGPDEKIEDPFKR